MSICLKRFEHFLSSDKIESSMKNIQALEIYKKEFVLDDQIRIAYLHNYMRVKQPETFKLIHKYQSFTSDLHLLDNFWF